MIHSTRLCANVSFTFTCKLSKFFLWNAHTKRSHYSYSGRANKCSRT
nr:hypothetical protein Iba_scaffold356614CG0010 [Ipomoea batatas]